MQQEQHTRGSGRSHKHTIPTLNPHLCVAVAVHLVLQQRHQHPEGGLLRGRAHHYQDESRDVREAPDDVATAAANERMWQQQQQTHKESCQDTA